MGLISALKWRTRRKPLGAVRRFRDYANGGAEGKKRYADETGCAESMDRLGRSRDRLWEEFPPVPRADSAEGIDDIEDDI